MIYHLSYINLRNNVEHYVQKDFATLAELETYVNQYSNVSSYEIIALSNSDPANLHSTHAPSAVDSGEG